jgi:hypothetical protein
MSKPRQEQEDLLKEDLDKDLVVLKDSMISLDKVKVVNKVNLHLEMFLKSLKSSLQVVKEEVRKVHKQQKAKTLL